MTYRGLPSGYACEWVTTLDGRGTGEATVVTTGPILFGTENSLGVNNTPNDLVVGDFDGVDGPDVAISVPATVGVGWGAWYIIAGIWASQSAGT